MSDTRHTFGLFPRAGWQARGVRWVLVVAASAIALLVATAAHAQNFRVTFDVDRGNPSQVRLNGVVVNDGRSDVLDVYVTAEALDSAGKVVGRGITFVSPSIPAGGRATFAASVPAVPGAVRYRVNVSSFRVGFGSQSG
jgi:hypothetical protein